MTRHGHWAVDDFDASTEFLRLQALLLLQGV